MTFIFIIMALTEEDVDLSFSDKGLFGFLRPDNFFSIFVLYGVLTGFMAMSGYIIATKLFNPVVVMNCFLIQPALSQMIGVMLDIDEVPGNMTWVGITLIALAINIIQYGTSQKKTEEQ